MNKQLLEETVARLKSLDANDRVKAASELGEIGTLNEAPSLLDSAYNDEASTVRQMAIQSYGEIMGEQGLEEITKAATNHFDDYTRIYAISILGNFPSSKVSLLLKELFNTDDYKFRTTVVRAMIHSGSSENAEFLFEKLNEETDLLTLRNMIEAFALWKFERVKETLHRLLEKHTENIELTTIILFALAVFGDSKAVDRIKNEDIDNYMTIRLQHRNYRGKDGLLDALDHL